MTHNVIPDLNLENARILPGGFKNFAGAEGRYNAAGDRNFCVVIDNPAMAQTLQNDGWNVRALQPRNPGDEVTYYLRVSVGYKVRPPYVAMITGRRKVELTEETVGRLDRVNITSADLTIHPRVWNDQGDVKAWLADGYFVAEDRPFDAKYADYE